MENQFTDILIEIEHGICRYYLSIKNLLNFNFSKISMQIKNLYMKKINDNINLLHLLIFINYLNLKQNQKSMIK